MRREEFKSLLIEWNNAKDIDILNEGVKDFLQKASMTLLGLAVTSGVVNANPIDRFEKGKITSNTIKQIYGKDKVDQRLSIMIDEVLVFIQEEDKDDFKKMVLTPFITLAKELISKKENLNKFDEPKEEVYTSLSELLNKQVLVFANSEINDEKGKDLSDSNTKYIRSSHSIFSAEDLKIYTDAVKRKDLKKQQEIIDKYKGK